MPVKGQCHQVLASYFSSTFVHAVSYTSEFLCANLNHSIEMTSLWIFVEPSCVFAGAVFLRHPKLLFFLLIFELAWSIFLCDTVIRRYHCVHCAAYRFVFFFAGKSALATPLLDGYVWFRFEPRELPQQACYKFSHPSPFNLANHRPASQPPIPLQLSHRSPCNLATHLSAT